MGADAFNNAYEVTINSATAVVDVYTKPSAGTTPAATLLLDDNVNVAIGVGYTLARGQYQTSTTAYSQVLDDLQHITTTTADIMKNNVNRLAELEGWRAGTTSQLDGLRNWRQTAEKQLTGMESALGQVYTRAEVKTGVRVNWPLFGLYLDALPDVYWCTATRGPYLRLPVARVVFILCSVHV